MSEKKTQPDHARAADSAATSGIAETTVDIAETTEDTGPAQTIEPAGTPEPAAATAVPDEDSEVTDAPPAVPDEDSEVTDAPTAVPDEDSEVTDAPTAESAKEEDDDKKRQESAEEFAREHDPANHDIAAGADARQPGDWVAADGEEPEVWDAEGNVTGGPTAVASAGQESTDGEQSRSGERRTSSLEEVRDGGYSVGSAAPIDDGALPLGHPVKGWEGDKTFKEQGDDGYDQADPDVWFTDADAAMRFGFSRPD